MSISLIPILGRVRRFAPPCLKALKVISLPSAEYFWSTLSVGESNLKGGLPYLFEQLQAPLVFSFADSDLSIDSASIDGVSDTRRFAAANVGLLLESGNHQVVVEYSKPFTPEFREAVPAVALNYPVGNINTTIAPSPSRWIIWLGGGSWGPAVVFWSKLLAPFDNPSLLFARRHFYRLIYSRQWCLPLRSLSCLLCFNRSRCCGLCF